MYSKYLEYSEAALKATRLAQAESEQKDVLIAHLKNEVYELRRIEGDYLHLNNLIRALEEKYSLLLDEKERCEKEQRYSNAHVGWSQTSTRMASWHLRKRLTFKRSTCRKRICRLKTSFARTHSRRGWTMPDSTRSKPLRSKSEESTAKMCARTRRARTFPWLYWWTELGQVIEIRT